MRLPKFIRYIKCKERLVRYTVNIDLLTRERILNSHFSMLTEKFSQIHSVSMGKWIRFSVPVAFYKKSKKFREFEVNATALCKSLGYTLTAGYSSGGCGHDAYYFYSVFPDRELFKVTMEMEGVYMFSPKQYVVNYYDKLMKLRVANEVN